MFAVWFPLLQERGEVPQKSREAWKKTASLICTEISEKGKPFERVGRKAMGPKACRGYGSPVASIL